MCNEVFLAISNVIHLLLSCLDQASELGVGCPIRISIMGAYQCRVFSRVMAGLRYKTFRAFQKHYNPK
jgi:hypothetical protein